MLLQDIFPSPLYKQFRKSTYLIRVFSQEIRYSLKFTVKEIAAIIAGSSSVMSVIQKARLLLAARLLIFASVFSFHQPVRLATLKS